MNPARLLGAAAGLSAAALAWALVTGYPRPEGVFVALVAVVSLRLLVRPARVPALSPRRVVAVAVAAYAAVFSFVTLTRHWTFLTHALDLGYYVQLLWNLAGGRGARVSLPEMHAWGDHLSPILYPLVPLFWIAPGPESLLVLQSAWLALGAVAVFALARLRLGDERPAAAFAVLYLVNPSLHGINVRDFHAAALAIPLLLAALCLAEAGRWIPFAAAILLALACREDAALPVIGIGAWLALRHRRWLAGAATAAGAAAVLAVDVAWVIPHFRGEPYSHLWRYQHLGRSLGDIAAAMVLRPLHVLGQVLTPDRLTYLGALLAPLAFLPLVAPLDALGALPALAQNLLSRDPILYHHRTQYQAFVLPFLILGAIGGYDRLARRRPGPWPARVLVVAMAASLVLSARTVNDLGWTRWRQTDEHRAAHTVLAQVPAAAAVSAHDRYVPHLSLRRHVTVFPVDLAKADHVLLHAQSYPWRNLPGVTLRRDGARATIAVAEERAEWHYTVVTEAGPHLLLRRQ